MATQLIPYIFFYGRCEEALEFYREALGGRYEMSRMGDMPAGHGEIPPGTEQRVMHATFTAEGFTFMASDGRETKAIDPESGNIVLSLTLDDGPRGERIFAALAAGGTVNMPIDTAFWGGRFGMVVDRFGMEWMISLP